MSSTKEAHKRKRDEELSEHKSPSTGGRRRRAKRAKLSRNGEDANRLAGSNDVENKTSTNGPQAPVESEVVQSAGGVDEKIPGTKKRKRNQVPKHELPEQAAKDKKNAAKQVANIGTNAGNAAGQHDEQKEASRHGKKHKRKKTDQAAAHASNPNGDVAERVLQVQQDADHGCLQAKDPEQSTKKPKEGIRVTTSERTELLNGAGDVRDNNAKRISTKKRRKERAANEQHGIEYNPYRVKTAVEGTVVVPRRSQHLNGAPWTVSEPIGGTFITAPLLTPNEK